MEMEADPLEGSSYHLGVTVKAEIKEEDEDDQYNTINSRDEVSRRRRVSYEQLESLWEFLNTHRDLAVGYNKSAQARDYSRRMWVSLSETLNSLGEGANKDWKGWSNYWVDYKAKLKRKVAAIRAAQNRTGGGPSKAIPLNNVEKKILSLLGEGFGTGMPNTQVDPLPTLSNEEAQNSMQAPTEAEQNEGLQLSIGSFQLEEEVPVQQQEEEVTMQQQEEPALEQPAPVSHSSRRVQRRPGRRQAMSQIMARRILVQQSEERLSLARQNAETWREMLQTLNRIASTVDKALLELAQCVQTNQEPIEFNSTDAMMDPKTGLMICLHCLEDFDPSLLSDHMINAHNYRRVLFKCHVCQNTFQERKLLMVHRQECQPEQKVRKRKTFQQIMREVEEKYFMEGQDLLENVSCPICLLELPKYCLKEHLLNEHRKPDVILTCGRCQRNFKSQLTLREHVKLVHEAVEDSEECELCGQKFRSLKYLANHKRNVHPSGNKIHKCLVCGKEFKSRLCLHQHSKYVHPPESASVECPHCPGKRFKSRINLTQHLKVSHGWKRK